MGATRMSILGWQENLTDYWNGDMPWWQKHSNFAEFIWMPKDGPNSWMRSRARSTADVLPANTPSSRYQAWKSICKQSSSASILEMSTTEKKTAMGQADHFFALWPQSLVVQAGATIQNVLHNTTIPRAGVQGKKEAHSSTRLKTLWMSNFRTALSSSSNAPQCSFSDCGLSSQQPLTCQSVTSLLNWKDF